MTKINKQMKCLILITSLYIIPSFLSLRNMRDIDVNSMKFLELQYLNDSNINIVVAPDWEREEIVWNSGYWHNYGYMLNPWNSTPAFGVALMYEPLFGYNQVENNLIPVIGSNISWNDNGDSLSVSLNQNAKWSDGNTISVDDVIFSYELASQQPKYSSDMQNRISGYTKIDSNTLIFHLFAGYENSSKLLELISQDICILPKNVWMEINTTESNNGDLSDFKNNWFDPSFKTDWMVCSGPYAPHYRDLWGSQEVYMFRDDWWGKGVIHMDLPNPYTVNSEPPKYIGYDHYMGSTSTQTGLLSGELDCYSGYYPEVWKLMESNSYINSYYEREYMNGINGKYYLSFGSLLSISPNHLKYPFNETWFRQIIAYSINYDAIPPANGDNYTTRASQGFINGDSPYMDDVYNPIVQLTYGISYNYTKALEILKDHADFDKILNIWNVTDSGHEGTILGPYTIYNPSNWADTSIACQMWAADISALNITCVATDVDFFHSYIPSIETDNFDMVMQTNGPRQTQTPLKFFSFLQGNSTWNQNSSNWDCPEYIALYQELEVQANNITAQQKIVSQMQELLAAELPEIVSHNNGFLYLYNNLFWDGWLNENNLYNQPVTVYTVNEIAIKTRLYLNLRPTGFHLPQQNNAIFGYDSVIIFIGMGVTSVIVILRKYQKPKYFQT